MTRFFSGILLICLLGGTIHAQPKTGFGKGTGEYGQFLSDLERLMRKDPETKTDTLAGKKRTIFVHWIRDHVHVMKAMKYIHPDMISFLEFYLSNQTEEGLYYDYFFPLNDQSVRARKKLFSPRYWKEFPQYNIEMHRLPVEADLEYLMVEGVYAVWQSAGDSSFVKKWLPALVKGMHYSMRDSLRWSRKHHLVKRGYTLDTWDFMQLPTDRAEFTKRGGDVQKAIFNIDPDTPMGIMHGDNSGMYAACNQLSEMFKVPGNELESSAWKRQAEHFKVRTNTLCWNGKFYSHFVEDDPQPDYLKMDQQNTLSMSNTYDINRGLPSEAMAQSIIQTYLELKESNKANSFAEWYGVYPAVVPHFADYKPGSYMNGGVNTIVGGELAKAAFQHGYETYGVDILNRMIALFKKHNGLPVSYTPQGKVDEGIPDNWGQAAVYNAMIEGLAGVVDKSTQFKDVEISPRWLAAGKNTAEVTIAYGPTMAYVNYVYSHDPKKKTITLNISGKSGNITARILLPAKVASGKATMDKEVLSSTIEKVNESYYVVIKDLKGNPAPLIVKY